MMRRTLPSASVAGNPELTQHDLEGMDEGWQELAAHVGPDY